MAIKLGVLMGRDGRDLEVVLESVRAYDLDAEVVLAVAADQTDPALKVAEREGVQTLTLSDDIMEEPELAYGVIASQMKSHEADYVITAGWPFRLGLALTYVYRKRIILVHPSLLPSFAGVDPVDAAVAFGVKVAGATVCFGTLDLANAPIIAQRAVDVEEGWDADDLYGVVWGAGWEILREVVAALCEGRVTLCDDGRVSVQPR